MSIKKYLLIAIILLTSSCSFLFGKSIPSTQALKTSQKNSIFNNSPESFKVFAKGYIKVDDKIDRLRMLVLCDLKNERFRFEIIPQNSSIPLGIITGIKNKFKYFNPLEKEIVVSEKSETLTEKLIGIDASHIDLCSIFSGKLIENYYPNLENIKSKKYSYLDLDKKNEFLFSEENLIKKVSFGKYTNIYKVFDISILDNKKLIINSKKLNLSAKLNYYKKTVSEFNSELFDLLD